jgi:regulator of replication initiation timing
MTEETQNYIAENEALHCENKRLSDKYHKAELEKEELQKRIEHLERTNEYHLGEIASFKYTIGKMLAR